MALGHTSRNSMLHRVCRLCLTSRVLRRSHVIPEFLFKLCYDKRHRGLQLDRRSNRPRYQQKGWRDHLLCDDCEQFLNAAYEQPMKSQWLDAPKLPVEVRATPLVIRGLDYNTFKLFHLSVLWRAAVASTDHFAQIKLGPHEERIRQMLRDRNPGKPTQYPLFAAVLLLPQNSSPAYDVVMPPSLATIDGQPLYQTPYGGCVWQIAVANHALSSKWNPLMLDRTGRLIATVHDFRKFWAFGSAWRSFEANRQQFGWPALPALDG